MKLVVTAFVTLDGIVEAPGFDEHRTGRNAWALRVQTEEDGVHNKGQVMSADALLLGRRTWQIWAAFWPTASGGDPEMTEKMNAVPKYVVSNTLKRADWNNTTILSGDVATQVAQLKAQPGGELVVYGSPDLVDELLRHDLVDEYRLLLYPVILGSGKRLFRDRIDIHHLRLVETRTFQSGVVLLTYAPDSTAPTSPNVELFRWTHEQIRSLQAAEDIDRTLATVLFADIVDSTGRAASMGDRAWKKLLEQHQRDVHAIVERWRGQDTEFAGDGVIAIFDAPTRALRCAFELVAVAHGLDIELRVGIHTGEIERGETGVGGIGVHIASRVLGVGRGRPGGGDQDGPRPGDRHGPDVQAVGGHGPAWRARRVGVVRGADDRTLGRSLVGGDDLVDELLEGGVGELASGLPLDLLAREPQDLRLRDPEPCRDPGSVDLSGPHSVPDRTSGTTEYPPDLLRRQEVVHRMTPSFMAIAPWRSRRWAVALELAPAAGTVVGDDLLDVGREGALVELLALVDGDHPAGLVAVASRHDALRIRDDPAVVQEDRHVVLRREQRHHVALQDEVRLDGPLDRLLDLGVCSVDEVSDLLADHLLPRGQGVDVGVDARILDVAHGVRSVGPFGLGLGRPAGLRPERGDPVSIGERGVVRRLGQVIGRMLGHESLDAGLGEISLEAGRRRDDQHVEVVGVRAKGVRHSVGAMDEVTRSARQRLVTDEPPPAAGDDEPLLIVDGVDVAARRVPMSRDVLLHDEHAPVRLG